MGMFDEIICRYPLPGTPPAFVKPGHVFQAKDMEHGCWIYQLGSDGILRSADTFERSQGNLQFDDVERFTGEIVFYASNVRGGAPSRKGGYVQFTDDGSDAIQISYDATFENGHLITLREENRTTEPALPVSRMNDAEFQPIEAELEIL